MNWVTVVDLGAIVVRPTLLYIKKEKQKVEVIYSGNCFIDFIFGWKYGFIQKLEYF